jgi:hypothetical protein
MFAGCSESHMEVINHFIKENIPKVIQFLDDLLGCAKRTPLFYFLHNLTNFWTRYLKFAGHIANRFFHVCQKFHELWLSSFGVTASWISKSVFRIWQHYITLFKIYKSFILLWGPEKFVIKSLKNLSESMLKLPSFSFHARSEPLAHLHERLTWKRSPAAVFGRKFYYRAQFKKVLGKRNSHNLDKKL